MKTKLRYNHAAYFGNFSVDSLEAYLPREIEIEQNEEFPYLEVDLKIIELSSIPENSLKTKLLFSIEGSNIELIHHMANFETFEEDVKDMLETQSEFVLNEITRILNEQFSNMVDAIKGNQENEIEKQKTEEFIRHNF